MEMRIYLVGGAVRDRLMGIEPKDLDFVITGATEADMDSLKSFRRVGKDFPVWVNAKGDEYSLARRERDEGTAKFDPTVTIEEDLAKRDLTINAMAIDAETGEFIDPYGGRGDLKEKILRHVDADSFMEDPVRVLRVARFAARFPDFGIAKGTHLLMYRMVQCGYLDNLQAERVWKELSRGLMEARPDRMLHVMRTSGSIQRILPEVSRLNGVTQPVEWHPEGDVFTHVMQCLKVAADAHWPLEVRYAVLLHDVGKGLTPRAKWPSHHGHEGDGVPLVEQISERLRVPSKCRELAVLVCREHGNIHGAFKLKTTTVVKLLRRCDAFRRPERFEQIVQACMADARGRDGRPWGLHSFADAPYPQGVRLVEALKASKHADVQEAVKQAKTPEHIPMAIHAARARAIRKFENNQQGN